ncbi:hypothetical protein QTV49_003890 [Vibrio vulnificus]|nr:hypothetical protein [Vibrio vulnificus]
MLDKRLKNIEWEVIGGETTMMPFEFWEEMLPYSLDRIERINQFCEKKGSLNFLTNLIYWIGILWTLSMACMLTRAKMKVKFTFPN